jgi:hypothetical protein
MSGPLLVVAGFAILTTLLAWARWLAGRRWAAAGHLVMAASAVWLVAATSPVVRHLSDYRQAERGQAVAELYFERSGAGRYRALLTRLPSGRTQVFDLAGDEWRLDVRSLEWSPRAVELGLRPLYRLERLASRAIAPPPDASGTPRPPLEFALGEPRGSDPWSRPRPGPVWSAAARATTLEGPWQPMGDGRRFEVQLQGSALVVKSRGSGERATRPR